MTIQSTLHYVSLGDNVKHTRNDAPRNAGKYYLNVNVYNPDTGEVFASDTDFDTMP